jgi:uncharacterized protein
MSFFSKYFTAVVKPVCFCLLCAAILAVASGITKGSVPFYGVGIACLATFLLTLLVERFNKFRLAAIGVLPTSKTAARVLLGSAVGFGLSFSQALIVLAGGHTSLVLSKNINWVSGAEIFLLYVFIAVREEIAFRGYPIATLNKNVGPIAAQSIVAAMFILEHLAGGMVWWQTILGPGTGAILFGAAALRSKGIAFPIGIHFAWNFGQWLLGFKDQTGIFLTTVDEGYQNQTEILGWTTYVAVMVMGLILINRIKIPMMPEQHL